MMRLQFTVFLTYLAVILTDDVIVLKQGTLKGHRLTTRKGREIFAFQGIPYARPPIGELRFQVRPDILHTFPRTMQTRTVLLTLPEAPPPTYLPCYVITNSMENSFLRTPFYNG